MEEKEKKQNVPFVHLPSAGTLPLIKIGGQLHVDSIRSEQNHQRANNTADQEIRKS
jgi:hypothetical protein